MATAALPGISAGCPQGQMWSARPICLVTWQQSRFKLSITCKRGVKQRSLRCMYVNDVIYDAEGTPEG